MGRVRKAGRRGQRFMYVCVGVGWRRGGSHLHIELYTLLHLGQRLLDTEGGESGGSIVVPALGHQLGHAA